MNTNPNEPTPGSADPKFQLIYIQARGFCYANTWQTYDQELISTLCEYNANDPLSCSDYNLEPRYIDAFWSNTYTNIANINSLIRSNKDNPQYNNIVQIARIWKAIVVLRLSNCFGDIPYSEAANDILMPKYDAQKDIYYSLFDELKDAASKIDVSAPNTIGSYDLVYGGNGAKWVKLANSLRLRMAVRISNVDPAKAKSEAAAAVAGGVFTSQEDGAYITQDATSGTTTNPIYYHRDGAVMFMSSAYKKLVTGIGGQNWPTAADRAVNPNITEAILNAKNAPAKVDPRAPIQFEPAGEVVTPQDPAMKGNWDGTEPGHINSGIGASMDNGQFTSNFAKIGPWYYSSAERPYQLFKFAELCFLKAIAIEKGLVSGNAKDEYEAGVRANMQEFDIPEATIAAYLNSEEPNDYGTTAKYNHTAGNCNTALDKILTQKYIAQFQEGSFETWADHRQFHKPTLIPFANPNQSAFTMNASDKANNTPNAYAKRLFYPSSEYTLNESNVKEAESRMGGNTIQKNVWWDVD